MREFVLNKKTPLKLDNVSKGAIKLEWYNVEKMAQALTKLFQSGQMDGWDLKQAKNLLKYHAKPIVTKMKQLAPVSSRSESITHHRHFTKGKSTVITRKHKKGELKRSIGVITRSRKYKKLPLIYVGVRTGKKYKNDGSHAWLAEYGRGPVEAKSGKWLYFANKDGSVVKTKKVRAFSGSYFFKKAMEAEGDSAIRDVMSSFAMWFGKIWENPTVKHQLKPAK